MKKFIKNYLSDRILSRFTVLVIDIAIIAFSCLLTYFLRYGAEGFTTTVRKEAFELICILVTVNGIFFVGFRTFAGILRFSSFVDLMRIVYSLTLGYGLSFLLAKFFSAHHPTFRVSGTVFFSLMCSM